jgi:hypothetical protein
METILQLLQGQSWFSVITTLIALASAITALTPTPKEDTLLGKVYFFIDFLALNIGKAKDKNPSDQDDIK